jgi:transcription initiation factor IIE alpha subunit
MPFATCDYCKHPFVMDNQPASTSRCPKCDQPLRSATREEFFTLLGQAGGLPRLQPADTSETFG